MNLFTTHKPGTTGVKTDAPRKTANSGFTMVELLAVIAILAIVGLVAVLSLSRLRLDLRQRELDSKAEILYAAAQNRMTELRAAGWEGLYQKEQDGVTEMAFPPADADEESKQLAYCYILGNDAAGKASAAADAVLPRSAVDAALWSGYWCIEFSPDSGSVYAVFYSEAPLPEPDTFDDYRSYTYRRRMGANVGYYGGDIAVTQQTDKLEPSISIENAEKLTATFYCNRPGSRPISMRIQLSDGTNTYTKDVSQSQMTQIGSRLYRYTWVLDDLSRSATRFYAQTGGKLLCGVPITVKLTAISDDPLVDRVSVSRTTNGLFDDRTDYGTDSGTALISYGRHLQNLDEASHVTPAITAAVQISDISFVDDTADDKDWYSYYGPAFTPITSDALTSYTGLSQLPGGDAVQSSIHGLSVSAGTKRDIGLFSAFSGEIRHVRLTGVRAAGVADTAGALIGRTAGSVTIADCAVYLHGRRGDLVGLTADSAAAVPARITGAQSGGLLGRADHAVTIEDSFAATTVSGSGDTGSAGGLIGYAAAPVSITGSYADCYLTAASTGGLIGRTADTALTTLRSCYAVGYQTASQQAAGFVPGTLRSARYSYSACAFYGTAAQIYSTAAGVSGSYATAIENVFYLRGDLSDSYQRLEGTDSKTYEQMTDPTFLGMLSGSFTAASGADSHPYNLLNQGLSTYSYPRLTALEHYGDWQAQFESNALVYYEAYSDGTYGFFGGNMDTLSADKTIVGDGYAVALSQTPDTAWQMGVACGGESALLTAASPFFRAAVGEDSYCLFPLPDTLTSHAPGRSGAAFLQRITVGERVYYFNPFFARSVTTDSTTPDAIYLRTARHLYALSLYYGSYADATAAATFQQERDIDYTTYDWNGYTSYGSVRQQRPIDGAFGFAAEYDGGGHHITGVSFVSDGSDVGMFAFVARSGQVRSTVLLAGDGDTLRITRSIDGSTVRIYAGALAGRNYGTISNCAASGYRMAGMSGDISHGLTAYNHSTVYAGGLVGGNFASGTTRSGARGIYSSEANCPALIVSAYNASVYAGGLTGSNSGGTIQSSYALGALYAKDVRNGTVQLGGFAGDNSGGILRYCYSATALTAAGEAKVYGLTRRGTGSAMSCYYLNGGTYAYEGTLYAYNTASNAFRTDAAGTPITGAELEKLRLSGFSPAAATLGGDGSYPYPAIVRSSDRRVTHYGGWPTPEHIGTLGVFYWEYESGGSEGYHLSYVGTNDGVPISGGSLCTQHNDGGVVTRYGYGYFYARDTISSLTDISYHFSDCVTGTRRSEVEQALAAQMKGYAFVAFETGPAAGASDSMYLTSAAANSTWTLRYAGNDYTYSVCPFFADSIAMVSAAIDGNTQLTGAELPGDANGSAYQIRSVSQLQNINWNYGAGDSLHAVSGSGDPYLTMYPYLGGYRSTVSKGESNFRNETCRYWIQSHDVNAAEEGIGGSAASPFAPIGSMVDNAHVDNGASSQPYAAYFASSFDGSAYTIRNVQIRSAAQCVGLFGFTVGADLKDIVLYSDNGSEVVNVAEGTHWYAAGGLVGFAGAGKNGASFTNCSVSGYTVRDLRANNPGWGGGCVGGLVGATNMNITGCSAVTDIVINIGYDIGYRNLRVGGIAGVCRATLDKCYAGGSIQAMDMPRNYTSTSGSTNIWVGGLVGGVILRDQGSLEDSMGTTSNPLTVQNCYSYVELPTTGNRKTHVVASFAIACNGEMLHTFSIKYNQNGISYTIPNPHAIITNSYCLVNAAVNSDDYKSFGALADRDWQSGKNINMKSGETARRVVLTNDRSPYISYADMTDPDKLASWLNGGSSVSDQRFDFVTVEENGARIDGKYSFPGADAGRLKGRNYPFPTILTQTDSFGRTVNIHYGAWPLYGIAWADPSATLDLFADRSSTGGLPSVTVRLYRETDSLSTAGTPAVTLQREDGTPADASLIGGVTVSPYDAANGCWEVTFTASGTGDEGILIARAELDGHTSYLTVQVQAMLSLVSNKPDGLTVYYGGSEETVTLSLSDSKGRPVTADAAQSERIDWTVTAETLPDGTAIVECGADAIRPVASAAGSYTMPVEGFAQGDAAISVICTYTYQENGVQRSLSASAIISARSVRDAVGLVYDVEEDTVLRTFTNGVYLPYTGDAENTDGTDVTAPDFTRESGSLYLFAGSGYTRLEDFSVDTSGLTAVGSDGTPADAAAWRIDQGAVETADGCTFRRLTVVSDRQLHISGTIRLSRGGKTYRLTLTDYVCGTDPAPPTP